MTVTYPTTFPLPSIDGYSIDVRAGVARDSSLMFSVQRRVFNTMPQILNLSFSIGVRTNFSWNGVTTTQLNAWNNWAVQSGSKWFSMQLPTMYAGLLNTTRSAVLMRFISDISYQSVSLVIARATVTAELAPSMIEDAMSA